MGYLVIYTLWLKPRTSLNIVIGGLAGSCAVLSGSAAVGAWAEPGALLLALALFVPVAAALRRAPPPRFAACRMRCAMSG